MPNNTEQKLQPGVYYVNYPNYNVGAGISPIPIDVGHAGMLVVNESGPHDYYEYGNYTDNVLGVTKPNNAQGNYRSRQIEGTDLDAVSKNLLGIQGPEANNNVRLTYVKDADPQKAAEYYKQDANNIDRKNYQLCFPGLKNCGSQAASAINYARNKKNSNFNFAKWIADTALPIGPVKDMLQGKGATTSSLTSVLSPVVSAATHSVGIPIDPLIIQSVINAFGNQTPTDFEKSLK